MTTGVRGYNPIWALFNLQGRIFDDTYYMFVLENFIPYIPVTVYHDVDLTVPWTQPIQFLSNGTLPVDIFFVPGVYRLEFRKGPTQSDPLIYEVNDYDPSNSDPTPVDAVSFASSNQITNPQFALMNYTTQSHSSVTDPVITIGPGWELVVQGTGSVTVEQTALNNANANPTNAPYALRLNLSGWNSAYLFQRFTTNGMLWANKIVSSSITARIQGAPQAISGILIDSNGTTLATVFESTNLDSAFTEYKSYGELGDTTNPNTPPEAYVDYRVILPTNVDIYLTSMQLVVQDQPVTRTYEQDTINRQIDHSYNRAYPIVPVGFIIPGPAFSVPEHYLLCDGASYDRKFYSLLFNAMTHVETVTLTSGLSTFTVSSASLAADLPLNGPLEGNGVPAGATIANKVGTTITMSAAATATGPNSVRFFTALNGNGSTTFNVYDLRGYAIAGANGSTLTPAAHNGIGNKGGTVTHTLSLAELAAHTHTLATTTVLGGGATPALYISQIAGVPDTNVTGSTGSSTPFSIVQPTALFKWCIRYQ